jgi:RND family efflux transporter MFP subunit
MKFNLRDSTTKLAADLQAAPKWLLYGGPTAAVVGLATVLFVSHTPAGASRPSGTAQVPTVAVALVTREDLFQEVPVEAEFRPYQEIDLHPKVGGFLQQINVDIGDRVKEGDLIATIEIPELRDDLDRALAVERRGEEDVRHGEAGYEEAHLAYTRLAAVNHQQPTLVAQQDLDAVLAKDREAASALAAAREQVLIDKADIEKLQTLVEYSKIRAPFSGVITKRYADAGALIQAGISSSTQAMPLVRLSENARLRLDFPVSVAYVNEVNLGDSVDIRVDALDHAFAGTISRFTRKVETDTRKMETEVEVPNADLKLIPGMYATVVLKVRRRPLALSIPVEAVSGKQPTVYLVNRDGVVEERAVTLGLETPTRYEVLDGLSEGDRIIMSSRAQVHPGQRVQTTPAVLLTAQ